MNLYKVHFDANRAISAERLYIPNPGAVKLETTGGKKNLKWITIHADNENESLNMAEKIVKDFFQFLKAA